MTHNRPVQLKDDPRPILSIFRGEGQFRVGKDGVTAIVSYQEPGQMAWVAWFAVYRGETIWCRVPGHDWGVEYDAKEGEVRF